MTVAVVLDQAAGSLRWARQRDPPQVVGVDLWAATEDLLAAAPGSTLLLPGITDRAAVEQVSRWLPAVAVEPCAEDQAPAPPGGERSIFVAADRVLRASAAALGWRPAPHPAVALGLLRGERYDFVRLTADRIALAGLPGVVPYALEDEPDGRSTLLGLLPQTALAAALDARIPLLRLGLDAAVEDPLLVQLGEADAGVGDALADHRVLWADGRRVLIALDAQTRNDEIPAHGPHGHFQALAPGPELLAPAPAPEPSPTGLPTVTPPAGLAPEDELVATPAPVTAASFITDVDRYAGARDIDAAGRVRSRHSSHPDNGRAVAALQAELAAIGYTPQIHSFSFLGRTLHNVIADLPGVGDGVLDPALAARAREVLIDGARGDGEWREAAGALLGDASDDAGGLAELPVERARAEVERRLGLPRWYPWWEAGVDIPGFAAGIIVVGAHLDSTAARDPGYDPGSSAARGADDDASGIAATLAIARHLWGYRGRLRNTVRFCFFNAEESGLIGSKAYAAALKATGAPVRAAICCDMIGHNSDAQRIFEVHAGYTNASVRDASVPIAELVAAKAASLGALAPAQVYTGTTPTGGTDRRTFDGAINRSDHAAFHQQGYPAVVVTEDFFPNDPGEPASDANPHYHMNADAAVDGAYGADITQAVSLAVLELAVEVEAAPSGASGHRIATGATAAGAGWQPYTGGGGPGIFIDVDTSAGRFTGTPVYVAAMRGSSTHWATTGGSAIYAPTATSFRVYVRFADGSPLTPADAAANGWSVGWVGVE